MKRISWEIVLAGLIFIFAAIYLLDQPSEEVHKNTSYVTTIPEAPTPPSMPSGVHVIELQSLEKLQGLQQLKELRQLENFNKLETLQSLKEVAHLIPAETRDEFLTELDYAIRELSNNEVRVNIDLDENLIVVNQDPGVSEGSWVRSSPGVYTYRQNFSSVNIESAAINLPSGNITVIGTNDSTASFTLQASGQIDNDDQLSKSFNAVSNITNGEVRFSLDAGENFYQYNVQIQAIIYIPEDTELSGNTGAGHIEITNITGDQVLETGGGHIKLRKVSGDIVAVTKGGHIWSEGGSGELTFNSMGGHLTVDKFLGDVNLKTSGGNIRIQNVEGEITCATSGGNIDINLLQLDHDITAETSAGNIQIILPSTISAGVDLKGSTQAEVSGFTLTDATKTRTRIQGEINGGRSDIVAFSKYGNVVLKSNDR